MPKTPAKPVTPPHAPGPAFPTGGPTTSSWREQVLARIAELHALTLWLAERRAKAGGDPADSLVDTIVRQLDTAKQAADDRTAKKKWRAGLRGSDVERVMGNLDAAEANILRLAPADYLLGQLPNLLAHVRRHLPMDDPRRVELEALAGAKALDASKTDSVVAAVRDAGAEGRAEVTRVRSFRNVLLVTALLMSVAVIVVGALGAIVPDALPLCFEPDDAKVVCPTHEEAIRTGDNVGEVTDKAAGRWDLVLIELLGLVAAAVAGAASLGGIKGTSTPYSLPVALAILKLPTGALTAVLGLVLMRGEFVPGLSDLDSSAQILAWAVAFGYAQQLFTRLIDKQAQTVLDDVGGSAKKASADE